MHPFARRLSFLFLLAVLLSACGGTLPLQAAPIPLTGNEPPVYLPLIATGGNASATGMGIHLPDLQEFASQSDRAPFFSRMAIFWFGRVLSNENYTDVRVAYTDTAAYVYLAVMDRRLWYDNTPTDPELPQYDGASLYLLPAGVTQPVRLDAQTRPLEREPNRADYEAAYRWNGSAWSAANLAFSTTTGVSWSTDTIGGYNNNQDNKGYSLHFTIPFSSLGLPGRPADGTGWKLGVVLHDRDVSGSSQPDKTWPVGLQANAPATWGDIFFGLAGYTPPNIPQTGSLTVRHGVNGREVPDATVGGWATCGIEDDNRELNLWTEWGDHVYYNDSLDRRSQHNVQNQRDLADWPCFSKYYITFPLDAIPPGKRILTANLTLFQFGNGGGSGVDHPPNRSLIQAITINQAWTPTTLSWNNAPLGVENIAQVWVDPLPNNNAPYPGVERTFNVARAVDQAYRSGQPLRLVFYTADSAVHSGKYFFGSLAGGSETIARPRLVVTWGD
jgi:hypothetical protein